MALDFSHIHDQLLLSFLDGARSLPEIAVEFSLTIPQLIEWSRSDRARADIDGYVELCRLRASTLAASGLPAAADTLNKINDDLAAIPADDNAPVPQRLRIADAVRKTATTITRMASRAAPAPASSPTSSPATRQRGGEGSLGAQQPAGEGVQDVGEQPSTHPRDGPAIAA